ncbi:MAG TPA: acyl-CoA dehydrogenase family protein [Chthonomonadaceae bacterium]|nr:acyl-CoA dehydrogenase family protein [Chthonomonadaceae bacterium]
MENRFSPAGGAFLIEETDPHRVFVPEAFSTEDQLIAKTAEDFLRNEVLPQTERIESGDHALMHALMQQAGALGLLGADVPEVYGGLGLSQMASALIAEKLNFQQSFALTHEAHTVIGTLPLLFFGNHDQKSRYLPRLASGEWIASFALSEANSGSDALALQTRAVLSPDGRHYLLNGVKMWITNTAFADLFTVFAKVDGEKVTAFLVERSFPGVSFGKEEHKLGMHGTSTRRVILENVPVPVENALEVGKGHYAAFCALNLGRFKLEAGAVGGLKALLTICAAYAKQRKTFGRPIAEYGLIQHKLAEMAARTFALESMVYRLAGCLDVAFAGITPDAADASAHYHRAAEEYAIECNIVKVIGSETYSQMADEAIQIHGGYGYTEEFPVARAWRDQRLLRIGEGANEIVRLAIINLLLRRDRAGRLPVRDMGLRATQELARQEALEMPLYDEPLEAIRAAAQDTKQLALFLLYQTSERLGAEWMEAQEIAAALADIINSAYALESVALRCERLRTLAPARYETALLAAQVAARDYADEALAAARYAFDSLPDLEDVVDWRDEPFSGVHALLDRLGRWETGPMQLRRDLAARVLEKEGYPL